MNFKGIAIGVLTECLIAAIVIVTSALLTFFDVFSERTAGIITFFGFTSGILCGGMISAKMAKCKAFFNSLTVGIVFLLIINGVSFFVTGHFNMSSRCASLLITTFSATVIGAVFGKH